MYCVKQVSILFMQKIDKYQYWNFVYVIFLMTMPYTVSYDEIKQKVITQANDHHRVKAYTP